MELNAPKGTRDFLFAEKRLRDSIVEKIKRVFERYGFQPIETPTFERYEVLGAKFAAGQESDALKETFRFEDQGKRKLGLRFDLTVPMARVVASNPQLRYPFKRYQIERVFRDGPVESNRYREFLQCDCDTVGAPSMIADAEILSLAQSVFKELNVPIQLRVNNRKLLNELLETWKVPEKARENALIALDKLDKQSAEEVEKEMIEKGVPEKVAKALLELAAFRGSNAEKKERITQILGQSSVGLLEMNELLQYCSDWNVRVDWDLSLVRGLAYYTGPVFEVLSSEDGVKGSIAGGGRYDQLIGAFLGGNRMVPATGISFGIERIFDLLRKKPGESVASSTTFFVFGIGIESKQWIPIVQELRSMRLNVSFDLLDRGASKNLEFASKEEIPFCIIVGENELKSNSVELRDMKSGKQQTIPRNELSSLKKLA